MFLNDIFLFLFPVQQSKEIFSGAVGGAGGNWIKKQTHILSCLPYNSYTPAFFHILGINQIVAACQTLFPNFFTGRHKIHGMITFM